jgi:hypothetical protein
MRNFFRLVIAVVGISIGIGGTMAVASIGEVVYTDADTGRILPEQATLQPPAYTATYSVLATGTMSATAIATSIGVGVITGTLTGTGTGTGILSGTTTQSATGTVSGYGTSTVTASGTVTLVGTGVGFTTVTYTGISVGSSSPPMTFKISPVFAAGVSGVAMVSRTGAVMAPSIYSGGSVGFVTLSSPFSYGNYGPYALGRIGFNEYSGTIPIQSSGVYGYGGRLEHSALTGRLGYMTSTAPGNPGQTLTMTEVSAFTPDGITSTKNIIDCQAPQRCNGASGTVSLLQTSTLTLSVLTGTTVGTVAPGNEGLSAGTLSAQGNAWFRTGTGTATQGTVSLNQNATLVVSQTTTSTATATAIVTNTTSVSPGLALTTGTNTVTMITANVADNPKINLTAMIHCSGCQLSGTGTGTATSKSIGESPEIIVTPASVGALPASSVSGTQNYHAKFGASGATLGNSVVYDNGTNAAIGNGTDTPFLLTLRNPSSTYDALGWPYGSSAASRNWGLRPDYTAFGDFAIVTSSAKTAGLLDTVRLRISETGTLVLYGGEWINGALAFTADVAWPGASFRGVWSQSNYGTVVQGTGTNSDVMLTAADGSTGVQVSTTAVTLGKPLVLRGSTSGAVTLGVAAVTANYSALFPSTAPGAGQAIVYPSGGGQGTWATPAVLTSSTPVTESPGTTGLVGTATDAARADHRHAMTAFGTTASTIAEGNDSRFTNARTPTAHASTHVSTGGDPIANVVPAGPGGYSGLMSAADKTKLDGIATGATNIVISAGTPVGAGFAAAAAGNSTQASASNHRHPDTVDVSVGGFYPQACSISTGNSIIAFPVVFWDRMPSALAAFVTVSVFNPNSGTSTSCTISAYSGSNEVQTLGATYMGGVSFSVNPGLHTQGYWTYAFTKPSGNAATYSVIHFYGYCTAGGYLDSAHVHITAGS